MIWWVQVGDYDASGPAAPLLEDLAALDRPSWWRRMNASR